VRTATLILSVLVHGGAIGALAAVGAYASSETRELPRVEILASVASAPSAERVPTERDLAPAIRPESSPMPVELPEDPIVAEPLLASEIIEDSAWSTSPRLRVSLARIVPVAPVEPARAALPERVEVVEPPPVTPAPANVQVTASPRADNLAPRYPDHERALGREGTVVLDVLVDRRGLVLEVELVGASYPGFNRAAMRAVRQWRFEPGMRDGVAVEDRIPVTIQFRLEDAR
jgi:protein TonB